MTYDVSTISRDNVIDLRYNTYGKIAGFNLSKSTGNLVSWKNKPLRGYSDEPALLHPGVWHLSFRRSSQHLYVICVYEIELDMFKFYDITVPSGELT